MFLILLLMGLSVELHIQASAQQRKSRDIIEFFKKAGENAIKAISGLIPGGKPTSQLTTQPRGPKIPLNTINEDAIKPVIPYKRNMIGELKNGNRMTTNLDNLVLKVRKVRFGNKRMVEKQQKELSKYNNRDKNNNKRQLNSERIKTKIGLLPVKQGQ